MQMLLAGICETLCRSSFFLRKLYEQLFCTFCSFVYTRKLPEKQFFNRWLDWLKIANLRRIARNHCKKLFIFFFFIIVILSLIVNFQTFLLHFLHSRDLFLFTLEPNKEIWKLLRGFENFGWKTKQKTKRLNIGTHVVELNHLELTWKVNKNIAWAD